MNFIVLDFFSGLFLANTAVLSLIISVTVKMYLMWLFAVCVCKNAQTPCSGWDLILLYVLALVGVQESNLLLNGHITENLGKTELPETLPSEILQQPMFV